MKKLNVDDPDYADVISQALIDESAINPFLIKRLSNSNNPAVRLYANLYVLHMGISTVNPDDIVGVLHGLPEDVRKSWEAILTYAKDKSLLSFSHIISLLACPDSVLSEITINVSPMVLSKAHLFIFYNIVRMGSSRFPQRSVRQLSKIANIRKLEKHLRDTFPAVIDQFNKI